VFFDRFRPQMTPLPTYFIVSDDSKPNSTSFGMSTSDWMWFIWLVMIPNGVILSLRCHIFSRFCVDSLIHWFISHDMTIENMILHVKVCLQQVKCIGLIQKCTQKASFWRKYDYMYSLCDTCWTCSRHPRDMLPLEKMFLDVETSIPVNGIGAKCRWYCPWLKSDDSRDTWQGWLDELLVFNWPADNRTCTKSYPTRFQSFEHTCIRMKLPFIESPCVGMVCTSVFSCCLLKKWSFLRH
jgi:hypothetical protein